VVEMGLVTLAVLAGGEGVRMGGAKSGLRIGGVAILQYLLERLDWRGPALLVSGVGNERPVGWELFDREVTDAVKGEGPLRGVLTALDGAETEVVALVTVDMPGVGREHVEWLAGQLGDGAGVMMSRVVEGVERVEPFPCVFRKGVRASVARRLGEGRRSVHSLGEEAGVKVVPAPVAWRERVWVNLNFPEDLEGFEGGDGTRS